MPPSAPTQVKVKKRCCGSRSRCKRCPVVLKRLAKEGLAERVDGRLWVLSPELTKKDLKAACRSPRG